MNGSEADSLVFSSSRPPAGGVFATAKGVTEPACRVKADDLLYGKKHDSGGRRFSFTYGDGGGVAHPLA
jgi:hypothetical protein